MARSPMGAPGQTAVAAEVVEDVSPNEGAVAVLPPTPKPSLGDVATTAVAEPDAPKASRGERVLTTTQTMTPSSSTRTTPSREQQQHEKEPEQLPEQLPEPKVSTDVPWDPYTPENKCQECGKDKITMGRRSLTLQDRFFNSYVVANRNCKTCREEHLASQALPVAADRMKPAQSRKRSRWPKKKRDGNEFALKPGNDYGPCAGVKDCIVVGGGPPPSEDSDQEDDGVDLGSVDLDNSSSPDVGSSSGSEDVAMSEVPDDDNLPPPPQSPAIRSSSPPGGSRPASVDPDAAKTPTPPHRPSASPSPGSAQMPEVSRLPPPPITITVVPPTPVLQQTNPGDSDCHHGHQQRHVGYQHPPHAFPLVSGGVAPAPVHHTLPARYESQHLEYPPHQEHSPSFDSSHNPYAQATYYASAATVMSRQFHPDNHPQPHHQQPPYPLHQHQLSPPQPWSQQQHFQPHFQERPQHQQDQPPGRLPGNLAPAHRLRPQHQENQPLRRLPGNLAPAHRPRAPVRYRARTPPLAHPESSGQLPSFAELTRGIDMSLPSDHPPAPTVVYGGANHRQGRYRYHPYSRAT